MRITSKLAGSMAAILGLGALAVGTIVHEAERELERAAESALADFTRIAQAEIGRAVERRVDDLRTLAHDPAFVEQLRQAATAGGADGGGEAVDADRRWRAGEDLELTARIQCSPLSRTLRVHAERLALAHGYPVLGELFATDAAGRNVAMSRRTTDYLQADEEWWIEAMAAGSSTGRLRYDESSGVFSTDLAVRVDDGERPLGVLKAVLDVRELAGVVESLAGELGAREVALFTPDGRLTHHGAVGAPAGTRESAPAPGTTAPADLRPGEIRVETDDPDALAASLRAGDAGPDLVLVVRELRAASTPVLWMKTAMTGVGVGLAALLALVGGGLLVQFSRRVRALTEAVDGLSKGELDGRVDLAGDDEVAEVARRLDRASRALAESRRSQERKTEAAESRRRLLEEEADARIRAGEEREALEVKLRTSQKLESIGQLAAGIAHEINTPIQYVGDNTRFAQDASRDLLALGARLRDAARAYREGDLGDEEIAAIERALEDGQLDFLEEELPSAFEQSLEGLARVTEIVHAMKAFSPTGHDHKVPVDLNEAVLNTITICRNEWKYVAEVRTELDEALPPVPCLPGEINQVVLNAIVNAAHAVAEVVGEGEEKGRIELRTAVDGPWARIEVRDTGCGMSEEVRERAFDPFYTTKEIGQGTGQGLALVHSVITRTHGGTVELGSEPGRGTTLILRLPLAPEREERADAPASVGGSMGAQT